MDCKVRSCQVMWVGLPQCGLTQSSILVKEKIRKKEGKNDGLEERKWKGKEQGKENLLGKTQRPPYTIVSHFEWL